jgi:predicted dehydrogenase
MKQPDALATKGHAVEEWTDLHFFRPVGHRLATAAARTSITADQLTMASLVVGLVAGHLFVYRTFLPNLVGLGLFIVSDILDSSDGQLARMRGTSTRLGRILDGVADGARFINLYLHLAIRLLMAGSGIAMLLAVIAALFSHSHQSMVVDFVKNAFRRLTGEDHDALDLPGNEETAGGGSAFARLSRGVYRDYIARQGRMFPVTVRLARSLGEGDLSAAAQNAWARRQRPVVDACAWIGQNIRWALLGLIVVASWPAGFVWITLGPLNLVALVLVLRHERIARDFEKSRPRAAGPKIYRGAILGLGGIARQAHLPAFHGAVRERFDIVAAVDGAPEVTSPNGIPVARSVDQLLDFQPLDFVDICTPTASHLPLTLWALDAGYHVLCEKPVALNRAEAARVTKAARRAGRVVFPCHQYRFNPVWKQIRAWLDQGAIGRWRLAEIAVHRIEADRGAVPGAKPWRGLRQQSRGGVLLDHGTHFVYGLIDVAGPPVAVNAWTAQLKHAGYDVEDTAQLVLEYPAAIATIMLTWAGHRRENHIRFIGEHGAIEWHGGALTLDRNGVVESVDLSKQADKRSYVEWFGELFASFADAIDQQDGQRHLEDITSVAAVLEAAYGSAATGRPRLVSVA